MRHLSLLIILLVAFGICACNESGKKEDSEKSDSREGASVKYEFEKETIYEYLYTDTAKIDSFFMRGSDKMHLSMRSYSLLDSAIEVESVDTANGIITQYTKYYHNASMRIELFENGQPVFEKTMGKLAFSDFIGEDMAMANPNLYPSVAYMNPIENLLLLDIFHCYPETDWCDDAFVMLNLEDGSELMMGSHGGAYCASELQVVDSRWIITCDGVYELGEGKSIDFDSHVVCSEVIENEAVMVLYDPITTQEIRVDDDGYKRFYEERDSTVDNAKVYGLDGGMNYSFKFDGYYMPFGYTAYTARTDSANTLIMADFKKQELYIPGVTAVERRKLPLIDIKDPKRDLKRFTEHKIYSILDLKTLYVSKDEQEILLGEH